MSVDEYRKILLEHYRNPKNSGLLDRPSCYANDGNPSCGDSIKVSCIVENGIVKKIGFVGSGCVLSQAAASILYDHFVGKKVDYIKEFNDKKVLELLSLSQLGPNRMKCARLPLEVIQRALVDYNEGV